MSDRLENGEARLAGYIKRAKKTDGLEFPVDVSDWHNAQVIEANVDAPDSPRRVLCRAWNPAERCMEWMSTYIRASSTNPTNFPTCA